MSRRQKFRRQLQQSRMPRYPVPCHPFVAKIRPRMPLGRIHIGVLHEGGGTEIVIYVTTSSEKTTVVEGHAMSRTAAENLVLGLQRVLCEERDARR